MAIRERQQPWRQQPHSAVQARTGWLRVYAPGISTRDLAGSANAISPGTCAYGPGQAGPGLAVNAGSQVTTGEMVPGISTGFTVVLIAEKYANISGGSDFIFGEHSTGNGPYNYGFYESAGNPTLLAFYTHNGTSVVAPQTAAGTWAANGGPQVFIGTHGDGDNNVRVYLNGVQSASAALTGSVQRNTGALLRSAFWNGSAPNFRLYAAAVTNRCMGAAEVADKFGCVADAWANLFEPQRIWVPVSAAAGAYSLTAETGAFTLTGNAAGLAASRQLAAAAGSFALAGIDAGLKRGYPLIASAGTFALTGQAAALKADRGLAAGAGAFTLTGIDVGLVYTPASGAYTLTADTGAFALTGSVAGLKAARKLAASAGSFTLTGQAATLTRSGYRLAAGTGSFALTGRDVALSATATPAPAPAPPGGGGWAWAAPRKKTRHDYLSPPTREQMAERVRKQREALGILPKPAQKRIEAAAKKEARRAEPSIAELAPLAVEVAQDSGIALQQVADAIRAVYDNQRGLVAARMEADAAQRREAEAEAAERERIEVEAAEQEWQQRLVRLRADDDELLRRDAEARQQVIETIRQVQKALLALIG